MTQWSRGLQSVRTRVVRAVGNNMPSIGKDTCARIEFPEQDIRNLSAPLPD